MALLFADPTACFYTTTAQAQSGLYSTLSASIATSGLPTGAIESTALKNVSNATIQVPQTSGPYYFGMRFIPLGTINNSQNLFVFLDASGNPQLTFQTQTNGTIAVKNGTGNGTLLGTSSTSTVMTQNVWAYIEFGATCNGSTGTVTIRINGSIVLSLTGVNTQGQGTTTIGACQILGANINNYVQDIYICDSTGSQNNTFLGDVSIPAYVPASNGTYTAYTPNGAASAYQCVNTLAPADGSVFISDSTPGDRASFNLQSSSVTGIIAGVVHVTRAQKNATGTRTMSQTLTSNGNDVVGPAQALGTSYAYYTQIVQTDPNTTQPWTVAGFNTTQIGVETIS